MQGISEEQLEMFWNSSCHGSLFITTTLSRPAVNRTAPTCAGRQIIEGQTLEDDSDMDLDMTDIEEAKEQDCTGVFFPSTFPGVPPFGPSTRMGNWSPDGEMYSADDEVGLAAVCFYRCGICT